MTTAHNEGLESMLQEKMSRRDLFERAGKVVVGVGAAALAGRLPHTAEASGGASQSTEELARNLEVARFNVDFNVAPETQIENIKANIKEARKLSPGTLHEIFQEVGTEVSIQDVGVFSAPVLTVTSEEYARFVLVHPDDERPFPNMGIDRYPHTQNGGVLLEMQGLYLGRVSRPLETSIGPCTADIGVNYRWVGGDGESEERTEIIEPFWLAWRTADNSKSSYSIVVEADGHFQYPIDISRSPDANGILLARALDNSIGIQASNMGFGYARPAQDFSQQAADAGLPGELYTQECVQAAIDAASKYLAPYKSVTLAQADKDGYAIKYVDKTAPPGTDIIETEIAKVFPEIVGIDIKGKLKELPNYKDYLTPDPITVEELLPLLRPTVVAVSPYKVVA